MYRVKEAFYTLQGEGAQAGRAAVFCRFSKCNLWTGREKDRAGAVCNFCDTDFVGTDGQNGGRFETAVELAEHIRKLWPDAPGRPYVVCTGGEPLLQLDKPLIDAFHASGFEVGVETNGTLPAPAGIDWLCVSPKGSAALKQQSGDELKLVYPQDEPEAAPERFAALNFLHFYLQPLDPYSDASCSDTQPEKHTQRTIDFCLSHPHWKLSLQTHKVLGIP